jgi:hypothetical protein
MPQRVRLPDQHKPITVALRKVSDNSLIQSYNTSADEIDFPDISEGFYYDCTNSIGQTQRRVIDNVTRILQMKNHIGKSVADGNTANHLEWITKGAARSFTYCGTVYNDIQTDAELNALGASEFDHTISHGSYQFPYDEVVRTAYLTSPSNLANRVSLRVTLLLTRDSNKLNNGSTITQMYSLQDCNMRQDGVTTTYTPREPVPQGMAPSMASPVVKTFAAKLTINFFKRYWRAINDGTILCVGWATGVSGEAEYPQFLKNSNGDIEGDSKGDFHPSMTAGFRAAFPEYAFISNDTIANNDLTGSVLGQRWSWYLSDVMRKFEWDIIAAVKAQIPQLTRTKWVQIDVGSYADELSPRRRTFNAFARMPQEIMVVKSNDDCNRSVEHIRFLIDDLVSIARYRGAIAISEPSPTGGNFDDLLNRSYAIAMMGVMKEYGCGCSFVNNQENNIDTMRNASGFQQYTNPLYKNEFKTISSVKKLVRAITNLSSIYTGGIQVKRNNYESKKSSEGVSRVDGFTLEDIQPTSTPPPSSTTSSTTTTTGGITSTTSSTSTTTQFAPSGDVEQGLDFVVIGNRTYTFQNGQDLIISVNTSNGNIRLDYPEFRNADGSSTVCKGWLLNSFFYPLTGSEVAAFRSSNGVAVSDDWHETFYVYYANASETATADDLQNKVWLLFGDPATRNQNSAQMLQASAEVFRNS